MNQWTGSLTLGMRKRDRINKSECARGRCPRKKARSVSVLVEWKVGGLSNQKPEPKTKQPRKEKRKRCGKASQGCYLCKGEGLLRCEGLWVKYTSTCTRGIAWFAHYPGNCRGQLSFYSPSHKQTHSYFKLACSHSHSLTDKPTNYLSLIIPICLKERKRSSLVNNGHH